LRENTVPGARLAAAFRVWTVWVQSAVFLACGADQTFRGLSREDLERRLTERLRPGTTEVEARRTMEALGFKEQELDRDRAVLSGRINEDHSGRFDSVQTTYVLKIELGPDRKVESYSSEL
jgi:hypothetical protein